MAVAFDKESKLFQINYQAPFGGIDTSANPTAIDPHNFVDTDGIIIEDNIIKPVGLTLQNTVNFSSSNYLGYIPNASYYSQTNPSIMGWIITDAYVIQLNVTNNVISAAAYPYTPFTTGVQPSFNYLILTPNADLVPVIYWTCGDWHEIWSFRADTETASLLTDYCGGGVLGLLNNQFLNLGGNSNADGYTPNRISWSAPGEYGQFQPYDVASNTGNYSAGFNDLPSVSDVLTGFAAIGTVGYIFRLQGITQMNPTGNGLIPFQFNHLWASELGVGAVYPATISQYGSIVGFISDSGIYTLGLNGLQEIAVEAKTYIYDLLNSSFIGNASDISSGIDAQIVPYLVQSPQLNYVISLPQPSNIARYIAINLATGKALNIGTDLELPNGYTGPEIHYTNASIYSPANNRRVVVPLVVLPNNTAKAVQFYTFTYSSTAVATVTFKQEMLQFGYVPTISKFGVLAALLNDSEPGTIAIAVQGENYGGFPNIVLPVTTPQPLGAIFAISYSDAVISLQMPQITLQLTNVKLAEVWAQGTLADYPLI